MKFKKNEKGLFLIRTLVVLVPFIVYGCNSNEYDFVNSSVKSEVNIESVAESDDFLNFTLESKYVINKFVTYTNTLSEYDFNELLCNVNNDDYMQTVMNKADISVDLQRLIKRKNKLLANNRYQKLTKKERDEMFANLYKKPNFVRVKTRTEIADTECVRRYNSDLNYAEAKCAVGIIGCACLVETGPGACLCVVGVMTIYADDIRDAKRAFADCKRQNK